MEDDHDHDDADLFEVADLDPSRAARRLDSGRGGGLFGSLGPRQRLWRLLSLTGLALLAVAAILLIARDLAGPQASVASHLSPSAPAIAIVTEVPTPVAGLLAPLPSNCPQTLPPATLTFPQGLSVPAGYFYPPAIFYGATPIWLNNPPQSVHVNRAGVEAWPTDALQFIAGPQYIGSVVVSGGVLGTNEPLWFNTGEEVPPPPGMVFASATVFDLSTNANRWTQFTAFPFFAHAGCYYLDVKALDSHWRMVFAVGR
jgi:hypothetical protein